MGIVVRILWQGTGVGGGKASRAAVWLLGCCLKETAPVCFRRHVGGHNTTIIACCGGQ